MHKKCIKKIINLLGSITTHDACTNMPLTCHLPVALPLFFLPCHFFSPPPFCSSSSSTNASSPSLRWDLAASLQFLGSAHLLLSLSHLLGILLSPGCLYHDNIALTSLTIHYSGVGLLCTSVHLLLPVFCCCCC